MRRRMLYGRLRSSRSVDRCGLPNRATGTQRARRKINLEDRKKLDWLVTASSAAAAAAGSDMIVSAGLEGCSDERKRKGVNRMKGKRQERRRQS